MQIKMKMSEGQPPRRCGACTLCCRLLPMDGSQTARGRSAANLMIGAGLATPTDFVGMVDEFDKPAGVRCVHQRHHKGCAIYPHRPFSCRMWNCRWLTGDDTADIRRPDHSHYVIDIMPDVIRCVPNDGGKPVDVQAVQVWVDPKHRDAHRDPALRAYLLRRGAEGIVAMIRYSEHDGFILAPPNVSDDGQWHEKTGEQYERHGHDLNPDNWRKTEAGG